MQSIFLQTPLSNLRGEEIEEARSISKIEKARVGSESRGKAGKQWTGMPAGCCLSRGVRCRKILAVGQSAPDSASARAKAKERGRTSLYRSQILRRAFESMIHWVVHRGHITMNHISRKRISV